MSRNPLFIKSEFSPVNCIEEDVVNKEVAILYSSSQNSLGNIRVLTAQGKYESQSFIHQVRILSSFIHTYVTMTLPRRNPLFIKSEFSQEKRRREGGDQDGSRNPLFIKSEFSHNWLKRSLWWNRQAEVAILYSSSQNSLFFLIFIVILISFIKSRNPLFIKSEFSRPMRRPMLLKVLHFWLYCRNPLFIKSEFSRHLRNPLPCMG